MRLRPTVTVILFLATCLPALANDDRSPEARKAADVKAAVAILGAGKDAQVALVQRGSNGELIGFVEEAGDDSFLLGDFCTDGSVSIRYDQVKSLWGKDAVSGRKVSVAVGFFRRLRGTGDPTRNLHCGGRIVLAPPSDPDYECCYPPGLLPGSDVAVSIISVFMVLLIVACL